MSRVLYRIRRLFSPSHQRYLPSLLSVNSHCILAPPRRNSILVILLLVPAQFKSLLPFPRVMEQLHQDQRFLSDLDSGVDFRPSGLLPDNLNLSPHHTTFDSFDLRPSSPHFPATPSYSGSYHNSPYSVVSDLDFDSKDESLGLFDSDPLAIPPREDYDPSKYDAPSSTGLLMFDDGFMSGVNTSNRVSVSVTPADNAHSPAYYDHGSPASSNGGGESGAENGRRSPASSVSSHIDIGIAPSPHLDFNQLRVESPYHRPIPIPSEGASPPMKGQSPPVLVIPEPGGFQQDRPVIHAPEGDGVGPRLHIVPATPVGGGEATQAGGFRNTVSQGPYHWDYPAILFAGEFVSDRSQDQQIHQLCHRRGGPIIHPTPRQTPQHHSRRLSSVPEPDPPALPASHLTSLRMASPMELQPNTQLASKVTITATTTFYPLLLLVLALNPTPLSVHLSGISTRPQIRLSILTLTHLTWAAGLYK